MLSTDEKFLFNNYMIDNISVKEAADYVVDMIENKTKGFVVTPNAAHFLYLRDDAEFRDSYRNASLILPDGYSLVLASKLLGNPMKGRCTGVDLFYEISERFRVGRHRIFLLGGVDGSEYKAKEKLQNINKELSVGTYSPPFGFENDPREISNIIRTINSFEPDIMFVFLGSPKSEKFINKNLDSIKVPVSLSLGATLDYYSGKKKRAPEWVRRGGLEWFFRILKEPLRLGKRYLVGNTYFLYLIARQMFLRRS